MSERTVVVTGGSRGIGLCICRRLLDRGYTVWAIARQETPQLVELCSIHPQRLVFIAGDLSVPDDLTRVCAQMRSASALFGLVNNAAVAEAGLHITLSQSAVARMLMLNVSVPMALTQAAVKSMSRRRAGRIVNISSVSAHRSFRGLSAYTATKAALEGFSRVLALEVGPYGITVNCVAPGYIESDMNAGLPPHLRERIMARNVLPRPDGDEVAGVIEFLLSHAAVTLTAQVIRVDSGATA